MNRTEAEVHAALMHLVAAGADSKRLHIECNGGSVSGLSAVMNLRNNYGVTRAFMRGFIAGFEAAQERANG